MDYLKIAEKTAKLLELDANNRDQINASPTESIGLLRENKLLSLFGENNSWDTALKTVQKLAEVDTSIAHLLGYHYLITSQLLYRGTSKQIEHFKHLIEEQYFFGNASNPLSNTLFGVKNGDGFIINGFKNFSTGSEVADYLRISWANESGNNDELHDALIRVNRQGITVNNDWDSFGQKQTGSGTVVFKNVKVNSLELIKVDKKHITSLFSQAVLLNIFTGATIGALNKVNEYIKAENKKKNDLMFLSVGKLYSKIKSLKFLVKHINNLMNIIWSKRYSLTDFERGEFAVDILSTITLSTEVSIEVANKMFEIMGARSTTNKLGYDRIWRNIRVLTLHSSIDLKYVQLGRFYLNKSYPEQGFYS